MRLYVYAALFWFVLFGLAALNGAIREFVLAPLMGSIALPASGLMLIALLAIAIAFFVRWNMPIAPREAWLVGGGWLAGTLTAETLLVVQTGRPAADVLAAFTWEAIGSGNLVAFAFVFVAVAPAIFASLLAR